MAYRIQYSPEASHRYPQARKLPQVKWGRWVTVLLILAAAMWTHLYGLPDFLIPGDPDITKAAAATMMEELREGVALDDAVTTFCKEILNGAGV